MLDLDEVMIVAKAIETTNSVDPATAWILAGTAQRLWNEMAELGWVDPFGTTQSVRVVPSMLAFARAAANQAPNVD